MASEIFETLSERAKTHGDFKAVADVAQSLKEICYGQNALSTVQYEALDMICSKIARIICGNNNEPDHWVDIQGYAKLAENEINEKQDANDLR